jgi:hypothetical protein
MSELAPLSPVFDARVERSDLDRGYAVVNSAFADRLRTAHARWFEVATTQLPGGPEQLTRDVPNVGEDDLAHLDDDGVARVETAVQPGTILVGKVSPRTGTALSPEEKLLRAIFGEAAGELRDTSLRAPPGCFGMVADTRFDPGSDGGLAHASVKVAWERPLDVGDVLLVGGEPVVVAAIRSLGAGADLAWSGGGSTVAVAKAAMARDVLHARSIGPYSPTTQQPPRGRERFGGQPLAPEQIEHLAAHAPWAAWEMLTIKADSVVERTRSYESIVKQESPDVVPRAASSVAAAAPAGGGGATRDIFSFFERPAELAPDEVPAVQPEVVTILAAYLRALGIELQLRTPEVGAALLSPEQLRDGSCGPVLRAETTDASTAAPVPGGLCCQKIFGPVKDYECACGKYKRMKHRGIVCETCGVEVIASKVRRERFGHVPLARPCLHPRLVGEVATLLGIREHDVREVASGRGVLRDAGGSWHIEIGEASQGGRALWDALERVDLEVIDAIEAGPRADLAAALIRAERPATALMLTVVPVLPPDLRRIVGRGGGSAASALDERYGELIDRNDRLARMLEQPGSTAILAAEQAQLQAAVDELMRLLAELADDLFERRVFGKPVDFSGVACLVADPSLPPDECRVPQALLLELFRPHAFGILEAHGYVTTIKSAKRMVEARRPEALWAIEEASDGHPVLLMAGATVVSRRVRAWDAPAIAVDPATARHLASRAVTVHVPLMHEAALQCAALDDWPRTAEPSRARGWLCRARQHGGLVTAVLGAALHGERDAVEDPVVSLALGRVPEPVDETERERWAERERERRERAWARLQPPAEVQGDASVRNPNLERRLDELEISVASSLAFQNAGLETVGDLCRRTESELLKLRGFGRKNLKEIKGILADLGLSLGMRDA